MQSFGRSCSLMLWLTALGSVVTSPASAGPWCDFLFREVASDAMAVALVEYRLARGAKAPSLVAIETLKGELGDGIRVDPAELKRQGARDGDRFLLALGRDRDLLRSVTGTGACNAINILPIHRGKLRSSDRVDYDGLNRALTLDELRSQLGGDEPHSLAAS